MTHPLPHPGHVLAGVLAVALVLPTTSSARKKPAEEVLPTAWTWTVDAATSGTTRAEGPGASGLPDTAKTWSSKVSWTLDGGWGQTHSDGSRTEWLRARSTGTALDGRIFGLRRFLDGELLKVERLDSHAGAGPHLERWDPVLLGLSPTLPPQVSARRPAHRSLQWTARVGSAVYLRTSCPAEWTLVREDPGAVSSAVVGPDGVPLEELQYTASCSINGRTRTADGKPVPIRGKGDLKGSVWLDSTGQLVRHELVLEREVRSRWPGSAGWVELIQDQSFRVEAQRESADEPPKPPVRLDTRDVEALLPELTEAWSTCKGPAVPHALTLSAGPDRTLTVTDIQLAPVKPMLGDVAFTPIDRRCFEAGVAGLTLPEHDDPDAAFRFVLPFRDGRFQAPGMVDRLGGPTHPLFLWLEPGATAATAAWLGVGEVDDGV